MSSTALAAGYASVATAFARRVTPHTDVSRTAFFIKSSARLGVWAALAGAAINYHYHTRFTSVVLERTVKEPAPPKLWEKTDKYTVDDGCLAGAAAGFVAFLPTLFVRRPRVSWLGRMLGMTSIGACTGILAAHSYFQYTGERQKAVETLDRQRHRRSLEFHHIFWDKLLMSKFDPLIQQYIRHNGIWHANLIPEEAYDAPEKYGLSTTESSAATDVPTSGESTAHYLAATDPSQHLKNLDVESIQREIENCERERQSLLKEAEYINYDLSRRQYEFCSKAAELSEDDKQTHLRELQLIAVVWNRIRVSADERDRRISIGKHWLKQKAALEAQQSRSAWLPAATLLTDPEAHDPTLSISELKVFQMQLTGEIKHFEDLLRSQAKQHVAQRDKTRKDLDDARTMLRAADLVIWEMEKMVKGTAKGDAVVVKVDKPPKSLGPKKPKENKPPDSLEPEKP